MQSKYKVSIYLSEELDGKVLFTIQGNNKKNVEQVENNLHIIKHEYVLNKDLISFLIGSKGERIKSIIDNSGLLKIDFDNSKGNDKVC